MMPKDGGWLMPDKIALDPGLCRDCQVCTLACSLDHEGECNLNLARLSVNKDMARYEFHLTICQQCASPACLAACPADAMRLDERGVVGIDQESCARCGACQEACPFKAIFYHEASDRYLKCDLCAGRAAGPLCVELCPVGALLLAEA